MILNEKNVTITTINRSNWHNVTEQNKCKSGSWKDFYIENAGKDWPSTCCKEGCNHEATDGAHVQNSQYGDRMYIVPLCHECNGPYSARNHFSLKIGAVLVRANQALFQ